MPHSYLSLCIHILTAKLWSVITVNSTIKISLLHSAYFQTFSEDFQKYLLEVGSIPATFCYKFSRKVPSACVKNYLGSARFSDFTHQNLLHYRYFYYFPTPKDSLKHHIRFLTFNQLLNTYEETQIPLKTKWVPTVFLEASFAFKHIADEQPTTNRNTKY